MKLRDYQVKMVNGVVDSLNRGRKPFVVSPTGSGKMVVIAYIAKHLNRKVLIVEHRSELVEQALEKLHEIGEKPGIIASGVRDPYPNAKIKVGMIQTMNRRVGKSDWAPDVLIFDEAHLSAAESYNILIKQYPKAIIVGFSATPDRLDGRGFQMFDEFVFGPTIKSLTAMGHLVPIDYRDFDVADLRGLRTKGTDWDQDHVAEILSGATEEIVDTWCSDFSDRPTVVFAANTKQSKKVCEEFKRRGVAAEHIDGTTNDSVRKSIMHRVKTGKTRVLVNCGIVIEGFDAPLISCVMLLIATKSLAKYLQCIGRGTRPAPATGKTDLIVADFGKCCDTHGYPDQERVWSLDGKSKGKREYVETEEDVARAANKEKYEIGKHDYGVDESVVVDKKSSLQRLQSPIKTTNYPSYLPVSWHGYWDELEAFRKERGLPRSFSEGVVKAEIDKAIASLVLK